MSAVDLSGSGGGADGGSGGFPGLSRTPPQAGGPGTDGALLPLPSTRQGPARDGPPGAGRSGPDGPAQVLGDILDGAEGLPGRTSSDALSGHPAWTGPLAGAQGLSLLDLAVGRACCSP